MVIITIFLFLSSLPLSLPPSTFPLASPPLSSSSSSFRSFNGKEELITAGEGKGATLSKAIQLTPTDPTIVPLTENTIVNPAAVRVRPCLASC